MTAVDPSPRRSPRRLVLRPAIFVTVYNDLRGTKASVARAPRAARGASDLGACIHDRPRTTTRGSRARSGAGPAADLRVGRRPRHEAPVRDAAQITRRRALPRGRPRRRGDRVEQRSRVEDRRPRRARARCSRRVATARRTSRWAGRISTVPESHRCPRRRPSTAPVVWTTRRRGSASDPGAPGLEDHHDARRRWDRAVRQHRTMVRRESTARNRARRGCVRDVRAAPRLHREVRGTGSSTAPVGRAWALPTRCDEEGLQGRRGGAPRPPRDRSQRRRPSRGGSAPTSETDRIVSAATLPDRWGSRDPRRTRSRASSSGSSSPRSSDAGASSRRTRSRPATWCARTWTRLARALVA